MTTADFDLFLAGYIAALYFTDAGPVRILTVTPKGVRLLESLL